MAAKFVVVLALVAAGQCSVVPVAKVDTDFSSFAYDVADPNTGDFKSQVETRVGGTVSGQYSLLDSDGTKRTVDYTADDVNGFNAVVRKEPVVAVAPVVSAPVVAKTVVSSPVYTASPVVKSVVSSPVYAASAPYVAARSYAPAVYTPRVYSAAAPTVYSAAAPAVYSAAAPTVYSAAAPAVYSAAAPTVYSAAAPAVYPAGVYAAAPSVYSSDVYAPSVYGRTVYGSPLTYSAYSAPVSYW